MQQQSQQSLPRNITLAFLATLLPKYFPYGNWLTFAATLLPRILQTIDNYES